MLIIEICLHLPKGHRLQSNQKNKSTRLKEGINATKKMSIQTNFHKLDKRKKAQEFFFF